MFQAVIKLKTRPEKRKELLQTGQGLKPALRDERGCLSYEVYIDPEENGEVIFLSNWKSQKDFRRHTRSAIFGVFLGVSATLSATPEIAIHDISKSEFLDSVEALQEV